MRYKFSCPHCSQHISVTPDLAGTKQHCPTCTQEFKVPEPEVEIASRTRAPKEAAPPGKDQSEAQFQRVAEKFLASLKLIKAAVKRLPSDFDLKKQYPVAAAVVIAFVVLWAVARMVVSSKAGSVNKANLAVTEKITAELSSSLKETLEQQKQQQAELEKQLAARKREEENAAQREQEARRKQIEEEKARTAEQERLAEEKRLAAAEAERKENARAAEEEKLAEEKKLAAAEAERKEKAKLAEQQKLAEEERSATAEAERKEREIKEQKILAIALQSAGNGATISAMKGLSDIVLFAPVQTLRNSKWAKQSVEGIKPLDDLLLELRNYPKDSPKTFGHLEFNYTGPEMQLFGTQIKSLTIQWALSPHDLETPIIGNMHFVTAGASFDSEAIRKLITDKWGADDNASNRGGGDGHGYSQWTDKANRARYLQLSPLIIDYGNNMELRRQFDQVVFSKNTLIAREKLSQQRESDLSPASAAKIDEMESLGGIALFAPLSSLMKGKWASEAANSSVVDEANSLPLKDWVAQVIANANSIENNIDIPGKNYGGPLIIIHPHENAKLLNNRLSRIEIWWARSTDNPNDPAIAQVEFIFAEEDIKYPVAVEFFTTQFVKPDDRVNENLIWKSKIDDRRDLVVNFQSIKWGNISSFRQKIEESGKSIKTKVDPNDILK